MMDRLTPEHGWNNACYDPWEICGLDNVCKRSCVRPEPCKIPKMLYRLAKYEDIGLTPSEILELLGEVSAHDQLKADGRLYIAPVKPDTVVWEITHDRIYKTVLIEYFVNGNGNKLVMCLENGDRYSVDEFGKKVFPTPDEAERALKERGN